MINVISKRCNYPDCTTYACYGVRDDLVERCARHKDMDMVRVTKSLCQQENCDKVAHYNISGQEDPAFCGRHKKANMINYSKLCSHSACYEKAEFTNNTKRACENHKTTDMQLIAKHTKHLCIYKDCETSASFGKLYGGAIHCAKHRTANEYDRRTYKPKCLTEYCTETPFYTDTSNNYPLRCESHKLPNDKNVVERPCKNCGLLNIINESTLMCNDCSTFIKTKGGHHKEEKVRTLIQNAGFHIESSDRPVKDGCTKYRPDIVLSYDTFKVIVEVDEHQHETYACECERARMAMVHQDFGGFPVIFVRFNPDSYRVNGKLVREYKSRERLLVNLLNQFKNVKSIKYPLTVSYLYYDEFDGNPVFYDLDYTHIDNILPTAVNDIFNS